VGSVAPMVETTTRLVRGRQFRVPWQPRATDPAVAHAVVPYRSRPPPCPCGVPWGNPSDPGSQDV